MTHNVSAGREKETFEERGKSRPRNQWNIAIVGEMNMYHEAKWGENRP